VDEDPILDALGELVAVGRANIATWVDVMSRVEEVRELRRQGVAYRDMSLEEGVSIIAAISDNQERLTAAAARFRRASVRELRKEGMSVADIARAFGVTRQRIAALLADDGVPEEEPSSNGS
jgi:lambda repressor-like predicted transcriptional regulator